MSCAARKPHLGRYAEGELPREERASVEEHLRECESCRWTVNLLEREEEALRHAIGGGTIRGTAFRPVRRMVAAAAVALVLLGGSLFALHRAYRQLGSDPVPAASRAVLVRAEAMPLGEFVALLSDRSGVPIHLHDGVAADARIDFVLVRPVRLASALALLEDFYGLRSRVAGDHIEIH